MNVVAGLVLFSPLRLQTHLLSVYLIIILIPCSSVHHYQIIWKHHYPMMFHSHHCSIISMFIIQVEKYVESPWFMGKNTSWGIRLGPMSCQQSSWQLQPEQKDVGKPFENRGFLRKWSTHGYKWWVFHIYVSLQEGMQWSERYLISKIRRIGGTFIDDLHWYPITI